MKGTVAPFSNVQPSLALNQTIVVSGIYPQRDFGYATGDTLGFINTFAGPAIPQGTFAANGAQMPIVRNQALYSIELGAFGGSTTSFSLPDLGGRTLVGAGTTAGLQSRGFGTAFGSTMVSPTAAQLPTSFGGGGQAFDNTQPSLAMTPLIATMADYPTIGGYTASAAFLGEVAYFSGNFTPGGWTIADGRLLSINENYSLFNLLGTTYGGDGISDFALPNLIDRTIVGTGAGRGLGNIFGQDTTTILGGNLPPTNAPVNDDQPSIALSYLIALNGIHNGIDTDSATVGQIVAYSGPGVPSGYALANGQLLRIADYAALYAVIGNTYGGDGVNTFELPNLSGRAIIGTNSQHIIGEMSGTDTVALRYTANQPLLPEPAAWAMMMLGFAATGGWLRRGVRRSSAHGERTVAA